MRPFTQTSCCSKGTQRCCSWTISLQRSGSSSVSLSMFLVVIGSKASALRGERLEWISGEIAWELSLKVAVSCA